MSLRIGSLFSGYGGLDLAVQAVLGGRVVWHADLDPGPCAVLAHRWPDVPNLRDVSAIDYTAVEPVDVLTGGFPCQDVSAAGKRAGLAPGTRSGLWSEFHRAIEVLRPQLVVIENVRGLLSAEAHTASDVEPDPWGLGDRPGRPALRALGAVLGDLAGIGYDARWYGLRAADAGAPHGRFRVFVFAWPTDPPSHGRAPEREPVRAREERPGALGDLVAAADTPGDRRERCRDARRRGTRPADDDLAAPDPVGRGRHGGTPDPLGQPRRRTAAPRGGAGT